ncbi:uncharacterized protein LOC141656392 [Silene latifolia]|uniref:uncharacterized protein LOC141656392 n=1 Tax=Silene latifolia TaxID=37657 RepID=UPI003D77E7BC
MVFVRGDVPSVAAVSQCLSDFARISGLHANPAKTSIYFGGVDEAIRKQIGDLTGYSEERFPFRYPGTGNLLSYAGKLQLITSVLFGLENCWCSALLLPKIVAKLVNELCKNYFWGIPNGKRKMIFQSWKSICSPWSEGGFNIKELLSWNKALLSRWIWLLTQNREGIWDKWSRDYNMMGSSIWVTCSKPHHAGSWRAILKTRDCLLAIAGNSADAQSVLNSCVLRGHFLVRRAYDIFRTKHQKLGWTRVLSCSEILPKHRVCTFQAVQKVLSTVDRISFRGYPLVNWCCLCKCASESHRHLFFHCQYSQHVRRLMLPWLGFPSSWSSFDLKNWLYKLLLARPNERLPS